MSDKPYLDLVAGQDGKGKATTQTWQQREGYATVDIAAFTWGGRIKPPGKPQGKG